MTAAIQTEKENDTMKNKLEQLFYFGLGSALMAKEKIEQTGESARSSMEESDRKAREFFDQAVAKGSEEREQVKGNVKELLKEAIDELGLATRADVDALREELARLRQGQS
jgi:polyhydroxyalkanoate synthesis regulator phasin